MPSISFTSADIHCDSCAAGIKAALADVEGIQEVQVDVDAKRVEVRFSEPASKDEIRRAASEAGYEMQPA